MLRKLPVRWDSSAVSDLENIHRYLSEVSEEVAKYVIGEILNFTETLGLFPEKNPADPIYAVLDGNFRSVSIWSYKIVYEVTDEAVYILKVYYGLRQSA